MLSAILYMPETSSLHCMGCGQSQEIPKQVSTAPELLYAFKEAMDAVHQLCPFVLAHGLARGAWATA